MKYSDIAFLLCISEIEGYTGMVFNQQQCKKILCEIKRLFRCGTDVMPLIEKLKIIYSKQSELIDKLEKLNVKINLLVKLSLPVDFLLTDDQIMFLTNCINCGEIFSDGQNTFFLG